MKRALISSILFFSYLLIYDYLVGDYFNNEPLWLSVLAKTFPVLFVFIICAIYKRVKSATY